MPPEPENEPQRLREVVKKQGEEIAGLKKDVATLAKGLKAAHLEILAEWDEEILPEGTEVCGVKF